MRGAFVVGCTLISMTGFIILLSQSRPAVSYFGAILASVIYAAIPPALTWAGSIAGGDVCKGTDAIAAISQLF
mgnify:FL=1